MELSTVLVFLGVALLTFLYLRKKTTLPGPMGVPIFGYLPFMGKATHLTLTELAKRYGPAFGITLGSRNCLVLNSYEALKETFVRQSEAYSGRPHELPIRAFDHENAFIYLNGKEWKESRGFSISALKTLGFGRQSLEPAVLNEIQFFLEEIEKRAVDGKTPIIRILEQSVGNAIATLIMGHRCNYDDPWFIEMEEIMQNFSKTIVNDFTFFLPWITSVPFLSQAEFIENKRKIKQQAWDLWARKIEECKKDPNNVSYISIFLEEQNRLKEETGAIPDVFSDFTLLSNVDVLAIGAFETTAVTLQWALYYLALNPNLKAKLYKEIDEVLGKTNMPSYQHDAKNMHYTRAFIHETHRMATLGPLGVLHITIDKATVFNHEVPVGTTVIPNFWAIHHDPKVFPNPEKFDPERFLNEKKEYVKHESVVPFSVGKRFCPGEYVAQLELFLYLTSLLQKYEFEFPEGEVLKDSDVSLTVLHPPKFSLTFKRRT